VVTSSIPLTEALKVTGGPVVGDISELDSATAGSLALILKPIFSIYSLLMIVRIVMTWYPEINGKEFPWSIAYNSTGTIVVFLTWNRQSMRLLIELLMKCISFLAEFVLAGTRKIVKPFNGLDVSPIVWVALLSFLNEILTGPQGILSMIERKGI
jgi:YggT family protein